MQTIFVKTFYLEMLAEPKNLASLELGELSILKIEKPDADWYRNIYHQVGKKYSWYNRLLISAQEVQKLINRPSIEIYLLKKENEECGFAELDRSNPENIELLYFGIVDSFQGQGMGNVFLRWIIKQVWQGQPKRFWLHTCELDHPAALGFYQKAGFVHFDTRNDPQYIP